MSQYGFTTEGNTIVTDFPSQVKNRTFLITGPSEGGIGAETAISLAHGSPSTILLLGRTLSKIQPTIDAIQSIDARIKIKFVEVSLDSLTSVRKAAKVILDDASVEKIDVVINNAAIMACPYGLSVDGYELQFATNHLSHFLLTNLILPKVIAAGPGARIVNLSSNGHVFAGINWESLDFNKGKDYSPFNSYAQAKTANILFTVALNAKLSSTGIKSFAVHPGSITSNLQKHMTPQMYATAYETWDAMSKGPLPARKTLQQGCSTTLRAALDPGLEMVDGSVYLSDCQVVTDPEWIRGYALDEGDAGRLWRVSEEMVGEVFGS